MSAQRRLQNGANFSMAGARQIGQRSARALLLSVMVCIWERAGAASNGAQPAEADGVALACEQRGHFIERQSHDIAVGADDLDNEAPGNALRRVAARLAAPF